MTDIVQSASLTVAVSSGNGGKLVLGFEADVPNLGSADATVAIRNQQDIGYVIVGESATPLIGLWGFRRRGLWQKGFLPFSSFPTRQVGDAEEEFVPI